MHGQTNAYWLGSWWTSLLCIIITLDRCVGSCNTAEDPFGRIYVSKKTEYVFLKVFNVTKGRDNSKTLFNHILSKFWCESDDRKCNSRNK